MTATVKTNLNKDTTTSKKINYVKKYPYWVYIVLAFGLAGLIVAIVTTALVSHVYWTYSDIVFNNPNLHGSGTDAIGPNDIWKLILINPQYFNANSAYYQGLSSVGPSVGTLATYQQFSDWCSNHGYAPFMEQDLFARFQAVFSIHGDQFNSALAAQLWNPNANAYYIVTCVFWIASVITLAIIFFNWWSYIVKQIKANQLPKAQRIAAKKAKKEAKALARQRKSKIKELKQRNLWEDMVTNNNPDKPITTTDGVSSVSKITTNSQSQDTVLTQVGFVQDKNSKGVAYGEFNNH